MQTCLNNFKHNIKEDQKEYQKGTYYIDFHFLKKIMNLFCFLDVWLLEFFQKVQYGYQDKNDVSSVYTKYSYCEVYSKRLLQINFLMINEYVGKTFMFK